MKKQTKLGLVLAAAAVISVSVASLVSAKGWVQKGADWYYVDNDGEAITDTIQSSGTAKFYLGADDGAMQKDYFLEDKDGQSYYFGSNGAMVTNTWVAIESSRVDNQGDYVPDNYWYYFQASGKAMKGNSGNPKKTTIDGKKYLFNEYGQMLTGWINGQGSIIDPDEENPFKEAVYYAGGDNDGVLRSGWVTYYDGYDGDDADYLSDKTNLYFYFNPSNNVMTGKTKDGAADQKTKKINGKTYAFDEYGVMLSKWDAVQSDNGFAKNIASLQGKTVYFSGEDDGHQVKKGWVYDVPADKVDSEAWSDDEEKYMYFNSSGEAVYDQIKKINGKYYVFGSTGIMKTGLVVWNPTAQGYDPTLTGTQDPHYIDKLDLDWATGEELSKKGIIRTGSKVNDYFMVNELGAYGSKSIKLHYFGEDGARKTGTNSVEFSDDAFTFVSNSGGDKGSGIFAKKYYALGIQLKASSDIKFGIYNQESKASGGFFTAQMSNYDTNLAKFNSSTGDYGTPVYQVLTTSGSLQKGSATAKKDADGNYWFIDKDAGNYLVGIYTVNVKKQSGTVEFKAEKKLTSDADVTSFVSESGVTLAGLRSGIKVKATEAANLLNSTAFDSAATGGVQNAGGFDGGFTISSVRKVKDNEYWVKIKGEVLTDMLWFQADYNGSSNKWIPFGVLDDAKKTASTTFYTTSANKYYQVVPNDDYFLNCFWK